MNEQDWFDRYQTEPTHRGRPQKRGIGAGGIIVCMLVTALLGGVVGSYFTKTYWDKTAAKAEPTPVPASAIVTLAPASATTPPPVTESAVVQPASTGYTKSQIVELCAPSVVGIDVVYPASNYGYYYWGQQQSQQTTGAGSGIVVTSDGYIVTCKHVVDGASGITVYLSDDTQYAARLIGSDDRNDLAVIKIDVDGLSPATLGDSDMLTVGEDVIAIGNPLGELRGTATGGMISAVNRQVAIDATTMTLLQTDAAISPGNSGGGLFNASGSLIGIVNAKASSDNAEGLGFAIPVNSVKQIISDLVTHGYVKGRAYLGVSTQNVTLSYGRNGFGSNSYFGFFYGGGGTNCVQVSQVMAGSAAEAAGVRVGDLILAVGETEISSNDALSSAISAYNAGESATLTVQRDDETLTLTVVFGEYAPAG